MRERGAVARAIERVLQVEKISKRGLARKMDISEQQIHSYLNNDIHVSSLIKILDSLDYEIVFRPKTGMGMVTVQESDPCAGCPEKIFSATVLEAMDNLRAHATEVGMEIDFYAEDN